MPPRPSAPVKPLSDDESERLADFLEAHSPFEMDGLLGLLNAVVVAPSLLPPSAWLPVVLPAGLGGARWIAAQRSAWRSRLDTLGKLLDEEDRALSAQERARQRKGKNK